MGEGRFRVYGYDIAPSAVQLSRDRAKQMAGARSFRLADFLRDEPPFQFDWLFEHTLFCAIQPAEWDFIAGGAAGSPGGNYLAVNYLIPTPTARRSARPVKSWWRAEPHFQLQEDWCRVRIPIAPGWSACFGGGIPSRDELAAPASSNLR